MIQLIIPKLPMRNKQSTKTYYAENLGFEDVGAADFEAYLIMKKDQHEIHFFNYQDLDISSNDGQIYIRVNDIEGYYQELMDNQTEIHPNGALSEKPWGMKEFSILDPDNNLLTFGENL